MKNSNVVKYFHKLISNKIAQKFIVRKLDHKLYKRIVYNGPDDLRAISMKKYEWSISLLNRIIDNMNKKYISKHVIERFSELFLNNSLPKNKKKHEHLREAYKEKYGSYPPNFLVISPTQKCNLNCTGCYASSNNMTAPSLPFDIFNKIVTEMEEEAGCRFIVISGGEPLMYNDNGKTILDIFELHPKMFFLFYTNGTLIDSEMAGRLEKLSNGIPAISVEGYEKETDERRGKGVYKKILQAMDHLKEVGMPFFTSITSTSKNQDILLSDEFYKKYFDELGCSYMWQFQLMPIGRGKEIFNLMPDPETRVKLYKRWESLMEMKKYPMADFWNSGVLTNGCIAYGRKGGYLYINWNGDIMPCVFVPYTVNNIFDIYSNGQHLGDVLKSTIMKNGRKWQSETQLCDTEHVQNLLMPCSIRDHYENFRKNILTQDSKGENAIAQEILKDQDYYNELTKYDNELQQLIDPIWDSTYLSTKKGSSGISIDSYPKRHDKKG